MLLKPIEKIIGTVVVVGVAFGCFQAAIHSPKGKPPKDVAILDASEQLGTLNEWRARRRLPPLRRDKELERQALETALENASFGRLQHGRLYGGARCEIIAENRTGFEEAVEQWNESKEGHREAIRSREYRNAGCACVKKRGRFYCCVRFK